MSTSAFANDLAACVARVQRSHQLGFQLEDAIATYFAAPNRIHFAERFDAEQSEYVFSARLVEPLPIEWGLLLSDAIHQARAACDNIVHALILRRGVAPSKRACFPPIFDTQAEYERWRLPRKGRGPLDGLATGDHEVLEQFQPWHPKASATASYLRILQGLSNEDKHRLVHPISVCVTSWGNRNTGEAILSGMPMFPRTDGTLGIEFITDFPAERLFPPAADVATVGVPVYYNDPLTIADTDIVRVPITINGPNPRLGFLMPRYRLLYTARGYHEMSAAPTILWARQAAQEVIDAIKPLLDESTGPT